MSLGVTVERLSNSAFVNVDRLPKNSIMDMPAPKKILLLTKHPYLRPYNRLVLLTILVNVMLVDMYTDRLGVLSSTFALANFTLALVIRQEQVINTLFRLATSVPHSWPLNLRWAAGKVYHFGGIHIGAFASGTAWFFFFLISKFSGGQFFPASYLVLASSHGLLLLTMIFVSLPFFRHKYHNVFEIIARFGSWASLLFFWYQAIFLLSFHREMAFSFLVEEPQIWILAFSTFCTVLPWLRLKKIPVEVVTPSNHVALAQFDYGVTPFAGSSTAVSRSPLIEWHSFANVPAPGKTGFRLTISRAGDWTGSFVDDKPDHVWVKGIPAAGVGNIELLFKKVVWIATGSGIGPCLPHLLDKKVPAKLVWSTRDPRKTYGEAFVDEILSAQPDAIIWDTSLKGKPDLVSLAWEAYQQFGAEAVICISNKPTTFHLNYQLEQRGIPAFGAIWDS